MLIDIIIITIITSLFEFSVVLPSLAWCNLQRIAQNYNEASDIYANYVNSAHQLFGFYFCASLVNLGRKYKYRVSITDRYVSPRIWGIACWNIQYVKLCPDVETLEGISFVYRHPTLCDPRTKSVVQNLHHAEVCIRKGNITRRIKTSLCTIKSKISARQKCSSPWKIFQITMRHISYNWGPLFSRRNSKARQTWYRKNAIARVSSMSLDRSIWVHFELHFSLKILMLIKIKI